MKEQDYRFWVDRIGYSNKLFDIIRIDHFRAFDTYWKIPADCPTAIDGEWIEAPGYEVIDTLQKEIPGLDLVAEDLGLLRPEVLMLKDHYHLKGMKILIFSIETGGKYARDTFHDVENMIFYTGTHDNDTIMQWYGNMSAAARRKIRRMLKKAGASQALSRTDSCSIPCRIRQNMRSFRWQIFSDLEKRDISTHRELLVLRTGSGIYRILYRPKGNCRNLAD